MRTSNRPMTPQAAFRWTMDKVSRPTLMNFVMDRSHTYVLKIGSNAKVAEFMQSQPDSVVLSFGEFCNRFGFDGSAPMPAPVHAPMPQAISGINEDAVRRIADEVSKGHISQAGAIFAQYVEQAAAKVLNSDAVQGMIDRAAKQLIAPTIINIQPANNAPVIDIGVQHRMFPKLLKLAQARTFDGASLNIALIGPAGTGKTTAAKMLGKALNRPVFLYSAMDNKYEFVGYKNANGEAVRTNAREAWSQPSVVLFDEMDACSPAALVALNGAIGNGIGDFADGNIERHSECLILAGANTWDGATAEFNGREKMDDAVRDRFVKLDWMIDETLEMHFAVDKKWCRIVQAYRKIIAEKGIRGVAVTPRATIKGDAAIAAGLSIEDAATITLRGGMTEIQFRPLFDAALKAAA